MKKIITALVVIILVIGSFAALSAPHVKAQTTSAAILSYSWYISQTQDPAAWVGDVIAVGEVQNTGTTTLGMISIDGAAYNSTGSALCTATASVYAQSLASGQKAPFYMDFNPEYSAISARTLASNWASSVTNVTLYMGAQITTNQTAYAELTTSNLNHYVNSGTYTVTGTITNTGSQKVGDVWAVTTFYDASGTVVAINYTDYLDPSGSLTPGNGVTFTATPADNTAALTSKIANSAVLVESTAPSGSSSTPTPTPIGSSSTPTHTGTNTSSNSGQTTSLYTYGAVTAVVIVVVALVALMMFRNRRKVDQSGAPLPPPPPPPPPPP